MSARRSAAIGVALVLAGASPAPAQDWQAGAPPRWQTILAAAKKEGRVAVVGPSELAEPIAEQFLKDTGITVDYLGGVAAVNSSRVAREVRAKNVTVDLMFTGTAELPLVKDGFFRDEKSQLLLPGVTDLANWSGGTLKWVDDTHEYMLQTSAAVTAIPYYDSTALAPRGLTSWHQMLDPKFKGKIVAYDPRSGGPGQQMVGYIGATFGIDFLKSLYVGQHAVYSQDSRQMVDWVSRGIDYVALGVVPTDYERLHEAGLTNLVAGSMTDGPGALGGSFSVIIMPKGDPHPNAATVFLNWIASEPGSAVYTHVEKQPSRRLDVHDASVLPFTIPKPGVHYLDQYTEDWALNQRAKIIDQILTALGGR